MQENNFEKQVRQKMDGLKLNPSEELWQKVAGGIKKDKHNRWLLAILLLLFISVATGLIIMTKQPFGREEYKIAVQQSDNNNSISQSNSTNQNVQIPATQNDQPLPVADAIQNADAKVLQSQQHINAVEVNKKDNTNRKLKPGSQDIAGIEREGVISKERNTTSTDLQNERGNHKYGTKPQVKAIINNVKAADEAIETLKQKDTDVAKSDKVTISDKKNEVIAQIIDTINGQVATLKEQPTDTLIKNLSEEHKKTAVSKKQQKQIAPWKIGFNFSLGTSTSQSGVLGIVGIGNGSMDKAFADALQSSPGAGTGTGSTISYTPSKLKAGLGFVAGAFVQKQISRKTNLLIGLNFKRYASSMMIGSRVDSAANFSSNFYNLSRAYYRTGAQKVYKNHFDFIELPLAFRLKLGKQHKLPVYLNTGVSVARLIGSNALQFDVATGAYYSNNDFFNKTHIDISAGVMFAMSAKAKNPLMAGPVLNFSLNKMADYGLYKNLHYSYLGLSVQKMLGKK